MRLSSTFLLPTLVAFTTITHGFGTLAKSSNNGIHDADQVGISSDRLDRVRAHAHDLNDQAGTSTGDGTGLVDPHFDRDGIGGNDLLDPLFREEDDPGSLSFASIDEPPEIETTVANLGNGDASMDAAAAINAALGGGSESDVGIDFDTTVLVASRQHLGTTRVGRKAKSTKSAKTTKAPKSTKPPKSSSNLLTSNDMKNGNRCDAKSFEGAWNYVGGPCANLFETIITCDKEKQDGTCNYSERVVKYSSSDDRDEDDACTVSGSFRPSVTYDEASGDCDLEFFQLSDDPCNLYVPDILGVKASLNLDNDGAAMVLNFSQDGGATFTDTREALRDFDINSFGTRRLYDHHRSLAENVSNNKDRMGAMRRRRLNHNNCLGLVSGDVFDDNVFIITNFVYSRANIANWQGGLGTYEGALNDDQFWLLEKSNDYEGFYYIRNAFRDTRIAKWGRRDSNIGAFSGRYYDDQLWRFERNIINGRECYRIWNKDWTSAKLAKWGRGDRDFGTYSGGNGNDQLWVLTPKYTAVWDWKDIFVFDNRGGSRDHSVEEEVIRGLTLTSSQSLTTTIGVETSLTASASAEAYGLGLSTEMTTTITAEIQSSIEYGREQNWSRKTTTTFTAPAGKNYRVRQRRMRFDSLLPRDDMVLLFDYEANESTGAFTN